ncbi:hypothetical protein SAMN02745246_03748 [Leeuwenhoekiella marinoflava DSM 3653]|uniref:Uncharacterized protein n=3 Tax=Leeuwenhoekiella marinoflava TaxID=988 RepID=A0A4Q0PBK3_9FLAO|nr:hypothetical protein DSL99_3680 [Leeuwenhoekiella marinoflava]SHF92958.1 hypothetical protein SAMN02745246_03748 [Leeuwenhoekiella marinoflava DSM 3653]
MRTRNLLSMKSLLVLFLLILSISVYGQNNSTPGDSTAVTEPVAVPQLVIKVPFGKRVAFGDVELEINEIIDSRCPKNVTCVWAGEVIVKASIYIDGKFIEERTLNLDANNSAFLSSEKEEMFKYSVLPYPDVTKDKIKQEDYVLNVVCNQF